MHGMLLDVAYRCLKHINILSFT